MASAVEPFGPLSPPAGFDRKLALMPLGELELRAVFDAGVAAECVEALVAAIEVRLLRHLHAPRGALKLHTVVLEEARSYTN